MDAGSIGVLDQDAILIHVVAQDVHTEILRHHGTLKVARVAVVVVHDVILNAISIEDGRGSLGIQLQGDSTRPRLHSAKGRHIVFIERDHSIVDVLEIVFNLVLLGHRSPLL